MSLGPGGASMQGNYEQGASTGSRCSGMVSVMSTSVPDGSTSWDDAAAEVAGAEDRVAADPEEAVPELFLKEGRPLFWVVEEDACWEDMWEAACCA